MLIDTGESPVEEENALEMLLSRNVDGIIAAPSSESPDKFLKMSEHMPVVLIDRYFEDTNLTGGSVIYYVKKACARIQ